MRPEHLVVERHRRLVGDRGSRARRLALAFDKAQAAFRQVLDRFRPQPEHRTGRRLDGAVDAHRLLPAHRDPEELPASALLQPVAVVVRHDGEHRVAGLEPIAAALVEQIAGAGDGVLQHGERRLPASPPFQS